VLAREPWTQGADTCLSDQGRAASWEACGGSAHVPTIAHACSHGKYWGRGVARRSGTRWRSPRGCGPGAGGESGPWSGAARVPGVGEGRAAAPVPSLLRLEQGALGLRVAAPAGCPWRPSCSTATTCCRARGASACPTVPACPAVSPAWRESPYPTGNGSRTRCWSCAPTAEACLEHLGVPAGGVRHRTRGERGPSPRTHSPGHAKPGGRGAVGPSGWHSILDGVSRAENRHCPLGPTGDSHQAPGHLPAPGRAGAGPAPGARAGLLAASPTRVRPPPGGQASSPPRRRAV